MCLYLTCVSVVTLTDWVLYSAVQAWYKRDQRDILFFLGGGPYLSLVHTWSATMKKLLVSLLY